MGRQWIVFFEKNQFDVLINLKANSLVLEEIIEIHPTGLFILLFFIVCGV